MTFDPRQAEAARRRVLDPYLNRLREWNHRIPGITGDRAATVLIGKRRLRVDHRERAVIEHWAPDREAPSPDSRLVMDSLSVMIKLLTELEQVATTPAAASRISAEIVLSVALGEAILKQLEPLAGKQGETLWSELKSRVKDAIAQARVHLDGTGEERIHALSATFEVHLPPRKSVPSEPRVAPSRSKFSISLADELELEQAATAAALAIRDEDESTDLELPAELQKLAEPPSRISRRTRAALWLCAASLLVWMLVVLLPKTLRGSPARVDLAAIEALDWVEQVTVRPASLYIDADGATWEALPHAERWQAMKQLVERAQPTGARGMLVRGEGDRPLAQWIEGRGIVLHDDLELDQRQITESNSGWQDRVRQPRTIPENPEIPARDKSPSGP